MIPSVLVFLNLKEDLHANLDVEAMPLSTACSRPEGVAYEAATCI